MNVAHEHTLDAPHREMAVARSPRTAPPAKAALHHLPPAPPADDGVGFCPARVLYITYDGILEAIPHSQVVQYLKHLSGEHRIVLLSFEKPREWADVEKRERIQRELRAANIRWVPLRYHHRPTIPATAWDIFFGILVGGWLMQRHRLAIVHARSYIPGIIALVLRLVFRCRFIFDMRGFWADERADSGNSSRHGLTYRLLKSFERKALRRADAIVSLTHAAAEVIRAFPYMRHCKPPDLHVIPTCADLTRFRPRIGPVAGESADVPSIPGPCRPFTLGIVGTVSGLYRFDSMLDAFEQLRRHRPDSRLVIVNRYQQDFIRERLAAHPAIPKRAVDVRPAWGAQVAHLMQAMDAAVYFLQPTFSKIASAPTKLGELLGCGVPVLTNTGIGDVRRIVADTRAGIVIDSLTADAIAAAIPELLRLCADPDLPLRCRRAAETHFSLLDGVRRYDRLYRTLTKVTA